MTTSEVHILVNLYQILKKNFFKYGVVPYKSTVKSYKLKIFKFFTLKILKMEVSLPKCVFSPTYVCIVIRFLIAKIIIIIFLYNIIIILFILFIIIIFMII